MGKEGYIGTRFLDGPVGCAGIAGSGLEVPGLAAWQGAPRTSLSLTARLGSLRVPPRKCASPSSRACLPVRTCPHSGMADAGCAGATSWAHHGLGGSQSLPRGCASCPLRRTGSLTQEERVPLAEVLGCSGGHSHFHCHPRHALLPRAFWTQLPTSTQLVVPKQTGPAHLAYSPALLWACGNKGSQPPLSKPRRDLAFPKLLGRPCPGAPSLPAAGPCSPGTRVPMQVQDDRVAGRQGILVPHLVLPLGILPPDSRDRVPGSSSRGERQVTRPQAGCP